MNEKQKSIAAASHRPQARPGCAAAGAGPAATAADGNAQAGLDAVPLPPQQQQGTHAANGHGFVQGQEPDGQQQQQQQGEAGQAAADGTSRGAQPPAGSAPPAPPLAVVPDNTYMSREARHIERERNGDLEVRYIKNDSSIESGRLLVGLKNVFAKCLPNMPKEYICRLIFERRHK